MEETKEKVFNHTAHKALWDWVSKHPSALKSSWPGWTINGGEFEINSNACFACDYEGHKSTWCDKCPLIWTDGIKCFKDGGLYDTFAKSNSEELRSKYAVMIRDLPVRAHIKCI